MTERERLIELICEGMQGECVAHCSTRRKFWEIIQIVAFLKK